MSFLSITIGLLLSGSAFADTPATTTETATNTQTIQQTNTATNTDAETTTGTETGTDTATATETKTESAPSVSMKPNKEKAPAKEASDAHEEGGHVAGQFTIDAMWTASSTPVRIVLLTLLFMMIACIFVGIERLIALHASSKESDTLRETIEILFQNSSFQENTLVGQINLLKQNTDSQEPSYLKSIMSAGITEFSTRQDIHGIEAVERALEKIIAVETKALGKGMNILATTGATAPFVGLVGTIFGIINAFSQIGSSGGGDLMTLAPAIGEALITTAFGIMVALVGVWIFNFFTGYTDRILNQMSVQSQSFIDWCYKQSAPPIENSNT
jgi:biopolymer transport protein ExbB/TolQ